MTGIVIPTYNRPEYLQQTLESLLDADLHNCYLICVDDHSTDSAVLKFIKDFPLWRAVILKPSNTGIQDSLRIGLDLLNEFKCDYLMNLDSDAIVKPNFVNVLTGLNARFPSNIISGFNTVTVDEKTNRPRHPILKTIGDYHVKASVGGINLCMKRETYRRDVRPYLIKSAAGWDWMMCRALRAKRNFHFFVSNPSVVQHIGFNSTFENRGGADYSEDFYGEPIQKISRAG